MIDIQSNKYIDDGNLEEDVSYYEMEKSNPHEYYGTAEATTKLLSDSSRRRRYFHQLHSPDCWSKNMRRILFHLIVMTTV